MEFIDVEEEFVVDESGAGAWVPVSQLKPQQAAAAQLPGKAKKGKGAKKARSGGGQRGAQRLAGGAGRGARCGELLGIRHSMH